MTLAELYTTLSSTNIPVAYNAFPKNQALPCITYEVAYSDNVSADSKVYAKYLIVDISLYTATKDLTKEALLESALDGASLFYNKTESYFPDEKSFQINYEVKING